MSDIEKQIEKNILFLRKVEEIAIKIPVPADNEQEMLFYGFFSVSLSHYQAINILCKSELYGSAFSLIRVLFDALIRAEYLYCGVPVEKIHELYNGLNWNNFGKDKKDNVFPTIPVMCKKIDEQYGNTFSFYSDITNKDIEYNPYNYMNDYTHTGFSQMCSYFNSENGTIGQNFDESRIIDCLISCKTIVRLSAISFFGKIGLKNEKIQEEDIENFLKDTQ